MKDFIDEIFQYIDETFEITPEKPREKFQKIPRGRGRPFIAKTLSSTLETPLVAPLEEHQHIKTIKRSSCLACGFIQCKID